MNDQNKAEILFLLLVIFTLESLKKTSFIKDFLQVVN